MQGTRAMQGSVQDWHDTNMCSMECGQVLTNIQQLAYDCPGSSLRLGSMSHHRSRLHFRVQGLRIDTA